MRKTVALLLPILALAVPVRWIDLGGPSLWDDEMHTVVFAQRPLSTMIAQAAPKDSNPLGYYFLLHYWLKLGQGARTFRGLSALCGTLAVAAIYLLGAALAGRRAGLWAALLAALHPLSIYCSREARAHTAALLALTLAAFFLVRLLDGARRRDAVGYALSLATALHLHYYAFFVFGSHLLVLLGAIIADAHKARRAVEPTLRLAAIASLQGQSAAQFHGNILLAGMAELWRRRGRALASALIGWGTAGLLFLPFLKIFARQLLRGQPWRPAASAATTMAHSLIYLAFGAAPDRLPTFGLSVPVERLAAWWWLPAILSLPLFALLARGAGKGERPAVRNLLLWLSGLPYLLLTAALFFQPIFDVRHTLLFLPPVFILAGRGLDRFFTRSRWLGFLLLVFTLAPMVAATRQARSDPAYEGQNWREAAAAVCAAKHPGDVAMVYHEEKGYAFAYYVAPCALKVEPLFDDQVLAMDEASREQQTAEKLMALLPETRRVWLIDYHGAVYDPRDRVRRELAATGFYHLLRSGSGRGVKRFAIDLFTRNADEFFAAFAPSLDLTGDFHPGQLGEGWYPPGEKGAWTTAEARVRLKDEGRRRLTATIYVPAAFYDGPVTIRLWCGDAPVAEQTVEKAALITLSGAVSDCRAEGNLLDVRLTVDRTFAPAAIPELHTTDAAPKGVLVQRIGLE